MDAREQRVKFTVQACLAVVCLSIPALVRVRNARALVCTTTMHVAGEETAGRQSQTSMTTLPVAP
jgi:hypothetical protein